MVEFGEYGREERVFIYGYCEAGSLGVLFIKIVRDEDSG